MLCSALFFQARKSTCFFNQLYNSMLQNNSALLLTVAVGPFAVAVGLLSGHLLPWPLSIPRSAALSSIRTVLLRMAIRKIPMRHM